MIEWEAYLIDSCRPWANNHGSLDLGLALTSHIARGELTIMIILVILSATIFFGFSVIRLCTLIARGDRARRRIRAEMLGLGGYVVPQKPIPVVLAQDEEAVGVESEASKSRPPAYGLWRESIVSSC